MRLVDELTKARGELTEEERKVAFEAKIKEEFEKIKQECREANSKKIRKITTLYTNDVKILHNVADLLRKEGLNVVTEGDQNYLKLAPQQSHWLIISW